MVRRRSVKKDRKRKLGRSRSKIRRLISRRFRIKRRKLGRGRSMNRYVDIGKKVGAEQAMCSSSRWGRRCRGSQGMRRSSANILAGVAGPANGWMCIRPGKLRQLVLALIRSQAASVA